MAPAIDLRSKTDIEMTIVGTPIEIMEVLDKGLAQMAVDELEVRNKKFWRDLGAETSLKKLARSGDILLHRVSRRWYRVHVSLAGTHYEP